MNYKKDPIYKAFNADKPDKQKTLAAAYAEMPRAKHRLSAFKPRYAIAIVLIVFVAALIPVFVYNYEKVFNSRLADSPQKDFNSIAPATPEQSNHIKFNFEEAEYFGSMPEGAYRVCGSYINNNEGVEERITVFFYGGNLPQDYRTLYINKLRVNASYTVTLMGDLTQINLYFVYKDTNYLIIIDCTQESRLADIIREIII